ncbi:MAG: Asp-tRNA(Asn)/Glu-tRNA(Gln) amidotransferase subunit GatA [Candidatus Wildermuthbacteria bacterium]|nr:Asp-tRNA(Asn)/Glu-tRNA(Gln) amidotransferase subunit GatA [Candidatus Wildermuthbacteria bacterium]
MNIESQTVQSIRQGLVRKEFSALEIAKAFLDSIKDKEKDINAFIQVTEDLALHQAKEIDAKISRNEDLPELAGVPCAIKDAILVSGERCTAGSQMLRDYIAPYDATVVSKIKKAGALIVGKTNMDEFGMGASTENSSFGVVKNPHDLSRVAGGSSGGSAASVAAKECVVSLGEDTGGSIRLPASFCGVVGLKPTYGAVSRYGVIALASSLDQVGPFAKTVGDAETVFHVIRGKDPLDATSVDQNLSHGNRDMQDLKIGIPKEYFGEGLNSEVEKAVRQALGKLESMGAKIVEVELPHAKYALAAYYVVNTSEASANLARYDGMRYGFSKRENNDLLASYLDSRGESLGPEVKRRIMLGTYALSAGYYDAYYVKALKIRTLLKQDFEKAFEKADIIAGPVSPILPFKIGEKTQDPLAMYLVDIYTVPANLVGLPAISLPAGTAGNLPVGLQLIAKPFQEQVLFQAGKALELS